MKLSKKFLFHLELKDSVTKAVMQIGLKYGQTVNEVNSGWWQKVKKRSRRENMSRTEIKVGWQYVLNTNKWMSDQLKYECSANVTLRGPKS